MLKVAVVALVAVVVSCGRDNYVDMVAVDPHSWQNQVSIIYDNQDTVSLATISVALRYNSNFKSDTLAVMLHTSLPDVYQCQERVTLHLAKEYAASAVVRSESVPYRSSCLLSKKGEYIFTIKPLSAVKGVEAVGIQIDR